MSAAEGARAVTAPGTLPGSPSPIVRHSCRLLGWSMLDEGGQPVAEALDTTVAAAAAGTLTLTSFLTVSLVRVTPAAAWPAGANQVTLSNVTGGTQTVDIEGGTANAAEFLFPAPLPTTGTPVVSVPAIAGGPAYSIEAEGTIPNPSFPETQALAQLVDGGQVLGNIAPPRGGVDTQKLPDNGLYVGSGVTLQTSAGLIGGVIYIKDIEQPT